jgi:peptide/nickel transport system ATP-binding protein
MSVQTVPSKPLAAELLKVQNLSVGINRGRKILSAVDDISFSIQSGEILGIVGESGCGKSLTALSIAGLLPQAALVSGGSVVFDGRNLLECAETELCAIRGRDLTMVFQEPASSLNPLIKIGAQIAEPAELHGQKDKARIRKEVLELMARLDLDDPEKLAEAYPHQLSGGMCQRVMIALAVICKPKLLIADEPTTALDVTIQAQILDLMKKINRELGTAILFISHDLSVVSRLCGRVLVMYAGKLVEQGPVERVFSHPVHEYTRGLLGSIPSREHKGRPLASIPGKVPSLEEGRPQGCPFWPRCNRRGPSCGPAFPAEQDRGDGHLVHCVLEAPHD